MQFFFFLFLPPFAISGSEAAAACKQANTVKTLLVKSYEGFSSKIKNDLIVSESQNLLTCKMVELFDWEPLQSMKFMPHRQFCPDSM